MSGVHTRTIYNVDWSHTHGRIVTAGADNTLRVFVLGADEAGTEQLRLEASIDGAHGLDVNNATWGPPSTDSGESAMLASCGDDELVKIWSYTPPYNPYAAMD